MIIDIQSSSLLANILLEIFFHIFIFRYLTLYFVSELLHQVPHSPDLLVFMSQRDLNVILDKINPLSEFSGFQIMNNDVFWLFEHLNCMIDLKSTEYKFIILVIKIVELLLELLLVEVCVLHSSSQPASDQIARWFSREKLSRSHSVSVCWRLESVLTWVSSISLSVSLLASSDVSLVASELQAG